MSDQAPASDPPHRDQPHAAALLVLTVRAGARHEAPPHELLERARAAGRLAVELEEAALAAVLRAALGARGADPACGEGLGAALEWRADGWRLVSLGARDPLHGAGGDEGIGPPAAGTGA